MVYDYILGIDEVGRGPLAGPVTVAAVLLNKNSKLTNNILKDIRDSKKLSLKQRKKWQEIICKNFPFVIYSVSQNIIDTKGIQFACRLAVARVIKKILNQNPLVQQSSFVIKLDGGLYAPKKYKHQDTIIKGDEIIPAIAAASIVAKIHRDARMLRLHAKYPHFGFNKHKGYGTEAHIANIKKYGLSIVHRVTFCKNITRCLI